MLQQACECNPSHAHTHLINFIVWHWVNILSGCVWMSSVLVFSETSTIYAYCLVWHPGPWHHLFPQGCRLFLWLCLGSHPPCSPGVLSPMFLEQKDQQGHLQGDFLPRDMAHPGSMNIKLLSSKLCNWSRPSTIDVVN